MVIKAKAVTHYTERLHTYINKVQVGTGVPTKLERTWNIWGIPYSMIHATVGMYCLKEHTLPSTNNL